MIDIERPVEAQPEPAAAPRPWWRRRPIQIAAAAAVIAAAAGTWAATASSSPGTIQIHGVLALGPLAATDTTAGAAADGDPCQAGSGYTDITAGAAVVVGNGTGQTIGTGGLQSGIEANVDESTGTALGNCAFQFSVTVPAGESTYTVTISHRGTQTLTTAQLTSGLLLTLGE